MQAVVITSPGGSEVLQLTDVPVPEPQKAEVRIKVQAVGLNRADILQRKGQYPPPADSPGNIPGIEFAGIVDKLGSASSNLVVGDRVFGLVGGGAYAQYLVTHSQTVSKIPDRLNFTEAAAVPEAFITAFDAMVTQAALASGDIVLINGVGSGVGIAAVQIAKAFNATTIGTSRSKNKVEMAIKYGLDHGIHVKEALFAEQVKQYTKGVDLVLELVGGDYVNEDLQVLGQCGRLLLVGLLAGRSAEIDLGLLLSKRILLKGTALRSRSLAEKIQVTNAFSKHLLPLFQKDILKPTIDKVFPLNKIGDAHTYMEGNKNFGKVILSIE